MTFQLPRAFDFSRAVLEQHTAFLGKTGSGKTSTAKLAVEQILAANLSARVCVLDPIKSDWWGMTSSSDGQRPGLPFYILGGPRGHVALHESAGKAIGELVATGDLPLSIIDMADFSAGGLQKFFNDFAPALMKRMRGVVYLVLEEAHEFAPKEQAGFGGESMAIHWAKKLATAGRSKGIRLMLVTQRTQSLHNALLGSCDTMIAHRLTAPADQDPVKKWLKANTDKSTFERVSSSLASLKTGTGWMCSGEAQVADLVHFPKISTFDNSATPTDGDSELRVTTAPVDRERLRAIIGDAVKLAEDNDVPRLRTEIARLSSELAKGVPAPAPGATREEIDAAYQEGLWDGLHPFLDLFEDFKVVGAGVQNLLARVGEVQAKHKSTVDHAPPHARELRNHRSLQKPSSPAVIVPLPPSVRPAAPRPASGDGPIGGVQQKILNSVAEMQRLCRQAPPRQIVAMIAGYQNVRSTGFAKAMSGLSALGLVSYPDTGTVALTETGADMARPRQAALTTADVQAQVIDILGETAGKILGHLITAYPGIMERALLAERSGYQNVRSTGFAKALSRLSTLGFVSYPSSGTAKAGEILFP